MKASVNEIIPYLDLFRETVNKSFVFANKLEFIQDLEYDYPLLTITHEILIDRSKTKRFKTLFLYYKS